MQVLTADGLRRAFLGFFEERGHVVVPSASLIPHDPSLLLTTAGMVQFKPYMLGDERAPYPRAASVQKCFRTTDIDIVGTTTRHLTFFEMLGNFSLGDYFKDDAIPLAWQFVTEVLGLDPDLLWVTVYEDDDEAADIWRDRVGVPASRVQRLGADDNFWAMGATGPCGPCSEIYFDRGPELGAEGGPAGGGAERYVEIWNLVFMQYQRMADGSLTDLPRRNIDTGAGLERILTVLQGTQSVFETDVLRRIVAAAETRTGVRYGGDPRQDVSLRILAEHGRAMSFLVADGVVPSNEDRGYVLRRIIRRAVRHAFLLGVEETVADALVDATIETMGVAYPDLARQRDLVVGVTSREEERFRATLRRGLEHLEELLEGGDVGGEDAFYLHDTLGFPLEVTTEIAAERGRAVDVEGFERRMADQRVRAQQARSAGAGAGVDAAAAYRAIVEAAGRTVFTGYEEDVTTGAAVVALLRDGSAVEQAVAGDSVEVVLDRTPFYAESGGQIGDTGSIEWAAGKAAVRDTTYGLPGVLVVHTCDIAQGTLSVGDAVVARVDSARREKIRRNHTATHLLHWALREVLGSHVKQAGSLVAPDRLRFDFSHFEAPAAGDLVRVEELVNREVLGNGVVRAYETTREKADEAGAMAFFGDKYSDVVRVIEAGKSSVELCGGTHVDALGSIGPVKIVTEGSVGANLRRIEAVTGEAALAVFRTREAALREVAGLVGSSIEEVRERVERLVQQVKALEAALGAARAREAAGEGSALAAAADAGVVAVRRDGVGVEELRRLAGAVREELPSGVVVLVGSSPDGGKAGLVVAVTRDLQAAGVSAAEIASGAAKALGGGTAKNPDLVAGGGPNVGALDEALVLARDAARRALSERPTATS